MFTNKNPDQTLRHKECPLLSVVYKSGLLKPLCHGLHNRWWPLTRETQVQSRLLSVGFVVDKVLLGEGFL